ncbi:hypothetical protein SPRG_05910 [Saprolegnia parasitica CBS 223.65]|uniref:LNR domain-containing protein n=1 Tax=Saprolegnia parasitica (strain CBS 223.65) TaxID=695850 RepID=A0A067CF41_SAPPC|nr:hypothetical protein SPRG_05910 [Saprolegnia parasitica CBS 223.65]KDO29374.1 hypothetical protein SPRG_05910 [Saprolegnia parasitica CBS 223.65]|eukprot:XP_012199877.1 hypothetical protein SPRG_05910 [Saprolegnia parasitica CBS 223.65]
MAFLKHLVSTAFLLTCTMVMLEASPGEEIFGKLYLSKSLSPIIYSTFAALNALAIASLLYSMKRATKKVQGPSVVLVRPTHWSQRWLQHDATLMVFQTIETTIHVLQAYRLSLYCVDIAVASAYALVISAGCLGIPWLFFSTRFFVKTTLVLFLNSFVSFVLAVGISQVQFLMPIAMTMYSDKRHEYSLSWMTRNLPLLRFLFPSSAVELGANTVLFASSWINLRRLVNHVRLRRPLYVRSPRLRSLRRSLSDSFEAITDVRKSLEFRHSRAKRGFFLLQMVLGLALLGNVVYTHAMRVACPLDCILETAPWFETTCSCRYLRLNCIALQTQTITSALVSPDIWGPHVFVLHIVQCPLTHGVDVSLLTPFRDLTGLVLEVSNLSEWRFNGSMWPPSLLSLKIWYANLTTLPDVVYTLPPNLQVLELQGNRLAHIPSDVLPHWQSLSSLSLSDAALTFLPDAMAQLTALERLDVSSNRLGALPRAWISTLPRLTHLEMANNNISVLGSDLITARPHLMLDLSNNPIASVPATAFTAVQRRRLLLDGSPFCLSEKAVIGCAPVCAESCSNFSWQDNVCQRGCNKPTCCRGDGGDCAHLFP